MTATADKPVLIFLERPRCPECGCRRLLAIRTDRNGDETITRRCRCADCGRRIDVVVE